MKKARNTEPRERIRAAAGDWDYKNNMETVFGVAWRYDRNHEVVHNRKRTEFTTSLLKFSSASDFGNFKAGYTGTHTGIPTVLQWAGDGFFEKLKNISNGDWDNLTKNTMSAPFFGDKLPDWLYNTLGMSKAKSEIEHAKSE